MREKIRGFAHQEYNDPTFSPPSMHAMSAAVGTCTAALLALGTEEGQAPAWLAASAELARLFFLAAG